MKVGYVYIEDQILSDIYMPEECLERGTLFPELDIGMDEYVGETMPK